MKSATSRGGRQARRWLRRARSPSPPRRARRPARDDVHARAGAGARAPRRAAQPTLAADAPRRRGLRGDRPPLSGQRLQRQRAVAGGNLALLAYERFGDEADRKTAVRLFDAARRRSIPPASSSRAGEALATSTRWRSALGRDRRRPLPAPTPAPAPRRISLPRGRTRSSAAGRWTAASAEAPTPTSMPRADRRCSATSSARCCPTACGSRSSWTPKSRTTRKRSRTRGACSSI